MHKKDFGYQGFFQAIDYSELPDFIYIIHEKKRKTWTFCVKGREQDDRIKKKKKKKHSYNVISENKIKKGFTELVFLLQNNTGKYLTHTSTKVTWSELSPLMWHCWKKLNHSKNILYLLKQFKIRKHI